VNDCILAKDSETLDVQGSISLIAWVKTNGLYDNAGIAMIVAKHYTHHNRAYTLWESDGDHLGHPVDVTIGIIAEDNTFYQIIGDRINDSKWHLVAGTYDSESGIANVYLDDEVNHSKNIGKISLMQTSVPVSVGCFLQNVRGTLLREFFQGNIDDVRIYNRALSKNEVQSLYGDTCIAPLGVDGANSCYQNKTQAWCSAKKGTWHLGKSCADFSAPLLVELSGFTAVPTKNGVALNWDTGAEPDSQGFHIWRGTPDLGSYCGCSRNLDDYKKISMLDKNGKPILIPTTGDERMGAEYSHLDKGAKPGIAYCYVLEDIDSKGESEFYFEYIVFTPDSVP
jgi:hypothetical protein